MNKCDENKDTKKQNTERARGKKNRKAAKTERIKANLTNEWEAQRHGKINSKSQQTPCVRKGEGKGRKMLASKRGRPANQDREVCQDRPAN